MRCPASAGAFSSFGLGLAHPGVLLDRHRAPPRPPLPHRGGLDRGPGSVLVLRGGDRLGQLALGQRRLHLDWDPTGHLLPGGDALQILPHHGVPLGLLGGDLGADAGLGLRDACRPIMRNPFGLHRFRRLREVRRGIIRAGGIIGVAGLCLGV